MICVRAIIRYHQGWRRCVLLILVTLLEHYTDINQLSNMAVRQVKPRVWVLNYLFHLWKLNHRLNAALDKL